MGSSLDNYKAQLELLRNASVEKDAVKGRKSAIDAITQLFKKFLHTDTLQWMDKNKTKAVNPAEPTWNVRAPWISFGINGISVFPQSETGDNITTATANSTGVEISAGNTQDRLYFTSFDITYNLGGMAGTNTEGTLKFYAKDPAFILGALDNVSYNKDSESGYPTVTLAWGWQVATASGTKTLQTPPLTFMVSDIKIDTPGSVGMEFTLKLVDIGSSVTRNTHLQLILTPDYPQQQIRSVIEGLLGFRLFTLDDLLTLEDRMSGKKDSHDDTAKTYFVNDRSRAIPMNGNNVALVMDTIASGCICRWVPSTNKELPDAIKNLSESVKTYDQLVSELSVLQLSTTATQADVDKKQEEVDKQLALLGLSCRLYWIENVPADWKTSSGDEFIKEFNQSGAFFLLPDLYDVVDGGNSLEVTYGPGASNFPYLHGSAMNVFNRSISTMPGEHSQTFGDVLSMNVQYSNLVELMASSLDEVAMFSGDSNYMATSGRGYSDPKTVKIQQAPQRTFLSRDAVRQRVESSIAAVKSGESGHKKDIRSTFRFQNPTGVMRHEIVDETDTNNPGMKQYYNTMEGPVYMKMKLRSRVNRWLQRPLRASIQVFGDPTLIRLQPGAFELLSYYPTENGEKHVMNMLASGVYFVERLQHSVSAGNYVTTLHGAKLDTLKKINTSPVIAKIVSETKKEAIENKASEDKKASSSLTKAALEVDLTDDSFTKGFLSDSLRQLYDYQKMLNGKPQN